VSRRSHAAVLVQEAIALAEVKRKKRRFGQMKRERWGILQKAL
jgi:hypothetical protein